jgi:hypothetical protein
LFGPYSFPEHLAQFHRKFSRPKQPAGVTTRKLDERGAKPLCQRRRAPVRSTVMCRPSGGDHNVFRRGFERDQIEPIGVDGRCVVREDSSSLWMINAEKRACSFSLSASQSQVQTGVIRNDTGGEPEF